jgi:hypothetical protein
LVRTSPNLGSGLRLLPKFSRLIRSYTSNTVEETAAGLRVIEHREYDIRSPAGIAAIESAIASLIDSATLAPPTLDADPNLHDVLRRCAVRQLAEAPHASPVTSQVRDVLLALLPEGDPSLDVVAGRLDTSTRMLLDDSDVPSFHRAFRQWTGMSPGAYRRSLTS